MRERLHPECECNDESKSANCSDERQSVPLLRDDSSKASLEPGARQPITGACAAVQKLALPASESCKGAPQRHLQEETHSQARRKTRHEKKTRESHGGARGKCAKAKNPALCLLAACWPTTTELVGYLDTACCRSLHQHYLRFTGWIFVLRSAFSWWGHSSFCRASWRPRPTNVLSQWGVGSS